MTGGPVGVVCAQSRDPSVRARGDRADSYLACHGGRVTWFEAGEEVARRSSGVGALVAAVDGRGPAGAGETAALAAVRVVAKLFGPSRPADPAAALSGFMADAHARMYWKARADSQGAMGCSVAAGWLVGSRLAWLELGSARAFLFRDGEVARLGRDWEGVTQRLIEGSHGLGDDTALHFHDDVNVGTVELGPTDRVVFATDGFWRAVDEASLAQLLTHVDDSQAAAVACMDRAQARGSADHLTVIVVRLPQPAPEPSASDPAGRRRL